MKFKKLLVLTVLLSVFLLLLAPSPFVLAEDDHISESDAAQDNDESQAQLAEALAKKRWEAIQSFEGIFMELLTSGRADDMGFPIISADLPPLDSSNPVITNIATSLFPILIPFYQLAILLLGIYYIWGAISPPARAQAKDQIIRLLIGMVLTTLSLSIFDFLVELQWWVLQIILSSHPDTADFGIADMLENSRHVLEPVGSWGLLVLFVLAIPTLGISIFCMGPGLLMMLVMPLIMPYFILAMRYVACLVLGAMMPLTIFLMSFDFTKGLGWRLGKMTITWIFVPLVVGIIVVIMLHTAEISEADQTFTSGAILFACLLLMGAAPMMVLGLMNTAGAMVLHAGMVKSDPKIMFLGNIMQGKGAASFTEVAYQKSLAQSSSGGIEQTRQEADGVAAGGKGRASYAPASWDISRGQMQAEMRQSGQLKPDEKLSFGKFYMERAKRMATGRKIDSSRIAEAERKRYTTIGERTREDAAKHWKAGNKGKAVGVAVVGSAANIAHGIFVRAPMAAVGNTLKAMPEFFVPKKVSEKLHNWGNNLTGRAVKLPGYGNQLFYDQGWSSFKNFGRSVKETFHSGYKNADGKLLHKGQHAWRGLKWGFAAGAGLSVMATFAPAVAPFVFVGGLGVGIGAAMIPAKFGHVAGASLDKEKATIASQRPGAAFRGERARMANQSRGGVESKADFEKLKKLKRDDAVHARAAADSAKSSGDADLAKKLDKTATKKEDLSKTLDKINYDDYKNLSKGSEHAQILAKIKSGEVAGLSLIKNSLENEIANNRECQNLHNHIKNLDKKIKDESDPKKVKDLKTQRDASQKELNKISGYDEKKSTLTDKISSLDKKIASESDPGKKKNLERQKTRAQQELKNLKPFDKNKSNRELDQLKGRRDMVDLASTREGQAMLNNFHNTQRRESLHNTAQSLQGDISKIDGDLRTTTNPAEKKKLRKEKAGLQKELRETQTSLRSLGGYDGGNLEKRRELFQKKNKLDWDLNKKDAQITYAKDSAEESRLKSEWKALAKEKKSVDRELSDLGGYHDRTGGVKDLQLRNSAEQTDLQRKSKIHDRVHNTRDTIEKLENQLDKKIPEREKQINESGLSDTRKTQELNKLSKEKQSTQDELNRCKARDVKAFGFELNKAKKAKAPRAEIAKKQKALAEATRLRNIDKGHLTRAGGFDEDRDGGQMGYLTSEGRQLNNLRRSGHSADARPEKILESEFKSYSDKTKVPKDVEAGKKELGERKTISDAVGSLSDAEAQEYNPSLRGNYDKMLGLDPDKARDVLKDSDTSDLMAKARKTGGSGDIGAAKEKVWSNLGEEGQNKFLKQTTPGLPEKPVKPEGADTPEYTKKKAAYDKKLDAFKKTPEYKQGEMKAKQEAYTYFAGKHSRGEYSKGGPTPPSGSSTGGKGGKGGTGGTDGTGDKPKKPDSGPSSGDKDSGGKPEPGEGEPKKMSNDERTELHEKAVNTPQNFTDSEIKKFTSHMGAGMIENLDEIDKQRSEGRNIAYPKTMAAQISSYELPVAQKIAAMKGDKLSTRQLESMDSRDFMKKYLDHDFKDKRYDTHFR